MDTPSLLPNFRKRWNAKVNMYASLMSCTIANKYWKKDYYLHISSLCIFCLCLNSAYDAHKKCYFLLVSFFLSSENWLVFIIIIAVIIIIYILFFCFLLKCASAQSNFTIANTNRCHSPLLRLPPLLMFPPN